MKFYKIIICIFCLFFCPAAAEATDANCPSANQQNDQIIIDAASLIARGRLVEKDQDNGGGLYWIELLNIYKISPEIASISMEKGDSGLVIVAQYFGNHDMPADSNVYISSKSGNDGLEKGQEKDFLIFRGKKLRRNYFGTKCADLSSEGWQRLKAAGTAKLDSMQYMSKYCEDAGGDWARHNFGGINCDLPTKDGGKWCWTNSQCESICAAKENASSSVFKALPLNFGNCYKYKGGRCRPQIKHGFYIRDGCPNE